MEYSADPSASLIRNQAAYTEAHLTNRLDWLCLTKPADVLALSLLNAAWRAYRLCCCKLRTTKRVPGILIPGGQPWQRLWRVKCSSEATLPTRPLLSVTILNAPNGPVSLAKTSTISTSIYPVPASTRWKDRFHCLSCAMGKLSKACSLPARLVLASAAKHAATMKTTS